MFKTYIEKRLGFKPSVLDGDLYYRRQKRPDGSEYYELLLVYVDDVLVCSHDPKTIMECLASKYVLKDGYEEPKIYLALTLLRFRMWTFHIHGRWVASHMSRELWIQSRDYWLRMVEPLNPGIDMMDPCPKPKSYKPELDTVLQSVMQSSPPDISN